MNEVIYIYPNPARDHLTVKYIIEKGVKAKLYLFNSMGELVLTDNLDDQQTEKSIDLKDFATGDYVFTIKYDDHEVYRELISIVP